MIKKLLHTVFKYTTPIRNDDAHYKIVFISTSRDRFNPTQFYGGFVRFRTQIKIMNK